jgi:hypothetical protein
VPPDETFSRKRLYNKAPFSGMVIASILYGKAKKGGAEMKNEVTRKEAANVMKVSVPTLRKFLEKHSEIIVGNKISIEKLYGVIAEESAKTLQKKGK